MFSFNTILKTAIIGTITTAVGVAVYTTTRTLLDEDSAQEALDIVNDLQDSVNEWLDK